MSDKMMRFLKSLGMEHPEDFDMDFTAVNKDQFIPHQVNMIITKVDPWEYPQLEKFLLGMTTIAYPVEMTFTYRNGPHLHDIAALFTDWFQHHQQADFPYKIDINEVSIKIHYPDQASFDALVSVFTSFQELLAFINYPKVIKHLITPPPFQVDQQKVDALNAQVKEIVAQKLLEEEDHIILEHTQRIKEAEDFLASEYADTLVQTYQAQAVKRIRKKGDYEILAIEDISLKHENVECTGMVINFFRKDYDEKMFVRFTLIDDHAGILVTATQEGLLTKQLLSSLKDEDYVRIRGAVTMDTRSKEMKLYAHEVVKVSPPALPEDHHEGKRVELHLHTNMSTMDGISSMDMYCQLAKHMGHTAIAITDHGVVQGFPEAQAAGKTYGVKIIYGAELYMFDEDVKHIIHPSNQSLATTDYVIFDLETTGLSTRYDRIVEFGAVRLRQGQIIDRLSLLINPEGVAMQSGAKEVTGIDDAMLINQPTFTDVFKQIDQFIQDAILVSHNAPFDFGFLNEAYIRLGKSLISPVIDTLTLSRYLYPDAQAHRLGALAKRLGVPYTDDKAHRAIYDAEVLSSVWLELKQLLSQEPYKIATHEQLNQLNKADGLSRSMRAHHVTVLAKDAIGLKALYELVSISHLHYFADQPRTPRQDIIRLKEHLLIGTACFNGEVFDMAKTGSKEGLMNAIKMYDFIEIQPLDQYMYLVHTGSFDSLEQVKTILLDIIDTAESLGKRIVATGDVHYALKKDKIVRDVYIAAKGLKGVPHPLNPYYRKDLPLFDNPDAHYRSTSEMLDAFAWLGLERSYRYVITNSQDIATMVEPIEPIKQKLNTPHIEGADGELRAMCFERAYQQYGKPLPTLIEQRLEKELDGIIQSGYAVIYYITSIIIKQANDKGYIVGSRGSVGSSFAATMAGITEVNPLPPHYYCPQCQYHDFSNPKKIKSGFDLPLALCPQCGHMLKGDGQNIPFATFLGFNANKVPDIDLNFPRDYQSIAHEATKTLLGDHQVYRAGTIETVAEKTAFGYVKGYFESLGKDPESIPPSHIAALAYRAKGVRRTSGQHPGGIVVVPKEFSVYDFTPIQRPADNQDTDIITTHFAFEALHDSLLKFDMLGHVDPMALKMNADLVGLPIDEIPLNDEQALRCFASDDVLKRKEKYLEVENGAMGLPEFGTTLGMDILNVIQPKTFNDLVIISGLAHGTGVFNGNARSLIQDKVASVDEVIGCRDDIMTYLIAQGIDDLVAFKIMEDVRKGKGLTEQYEALMREVNIPEFYIKSCKRIEYLFPKAHAAAYVMMAVRAAYFKVHHPLAYYATYFTLRSKQYDYEMMLKPAKEIWEKLKVYKRLKNESRKRLSPKDGDIEVTLMNVLEMKERGYQMLPIDLEKSHATSFVIDEERQGIIPPFIVIDGVGDNAARSIVEARLQAPFMSSEDVTRRTKVSSTHINVMKKLHIFDALDASQTVSLFSFDD